MDASTARAVLGIEADASDDAVRRAFRRHVRLHHPDLTGSTDTARTSRVLEAYRTLRPCEPVATTWPVPPRPEPGGRADPLEPAAGVWAKGDTIVLAEPAEAAWLALVEVADGLGSVSYVDRALGLLETIVEFVGHPTCSVMLTLRYRTDGTTETGCAVEALGGDPAPSDDAVAAFVAERLHAQLRGQRAHPSGPS